MAGYAPSHKELLARRQIRCALGSWRGVRPRPRWELVDEVIACGNELFGRDLAVLAKGGGVRDGGPFADFVEGAVDEVHLDSGVGGVHDCVDVPISSSFAGKWLFSRKFRYRLRRVSR